MATIYFITGTDTGVGKTVLTALLVRHLRDAGVRALAVKPLCSGGRGDATDLRKAQSNEHSLDAINPWHFRAALAPLLAARRERRVVKRAEVLRFIRANAEKCDVLLVEGAGGLLSPLGEYFDARDLIVELRAKPLVVCPNRLGAVNQVRLVIEALPRVVAASARVVLMETSQPNQATLSNQGLLSQYVAAERIVGIPRVHAGASIAKPAICRPLSQLIGRLF